MTAHGPTAADRPVMIALIADRVQGVLDGLPDLWTKPGDHVALDL
jgi:hypothetical protein